MIGAGSLGWEYWVRSNAKRTMRGIASGSTDSYDVFICHASEDKSDFVRPLATQLLNLGRRVWYDEFTLNVGDSLRHAIDEGLRTSRFGVVVLSPSFFEKKWPQWELEGLMASGDPGTILPVRHRLTHDELLGRSSILAGLIAADSSDGVDDVAHRLNKVLVLADSRRTDLPQLQPGTRRGLDAKRGRLLVLATALAGLAALAASEFSPLVAYLEIRPQGAFHPSAAPSALPGGFPSTGTRRSVVGYWSGLCAGPKSGDDGSPVALAQCGGGASMWQFDMSTGSSEYRLTSVGSSGRRCLAVRDAAGGDGAAIEVRNCGGGPEQRWTLLPVTGLGFELENAGSHKCLDDTAWSRSVGVELQQWACSGPNANQVWTLR